MTIPAALAAELMLLNQALDLPDTDLADTLERLVAGAQGAVDSYLGLTMVITGHEQSFEFTALKRDSRPEDLSSSLLVPLSSGGEDSTTRASIALVLYAAEGGAFVDLAADLAWITGRDLGDFPLDEHCSLPASRTDPTHLEERSVVDQALGVLISRGATPEQAERQLSARAGSAGLDPYGAACLVLAALGPHRSPCG